MSDRVLFELNSGTPWQLSCVVEQEGRDILCRIAGGEVHIGAVALSEWNGERARSRCLVGEGHREDSIATHAAHHLSAAWHSTAVCCCGIHFDGIDRAQIEEISRAAYDLATRAADHLRDMRLRRNVESNALMRRVETRAMELLHGIDEFLAEPWGALAGRHSEQASRAFVEHFGGRVKLFAPLYVSNACLNNCVYCGFRHSAIFKRTTLAIDDVVREAAVLADRGFRTIDLVTGEVPTDRFVDRIADVTEQVIGETPIERVNLNLGSLSLGQFRRLRTAGATGYHLYQECYDREEYFRVHVGGNKRDMASRIEGLRRAAEAGFPAVGMGVLMGLAPVNREIASLVAHAETLHADFPNLKIGFSLPRIQAVDPECSFTPSVRVTDDDLRKALLFLRVRFPSDSITLTTRERAAIRDEMLRYGITKMSAEVSTAPGGYLPEDDSETEQFSVTDSRTLSEVEAAIRDAQLIASY